MGMAATIIQTIAALGFLLSVVYDHRQRFRLNEQEQKDATMKALQALWNFSPKQPNNMTSEEAAGFPSSRQIEFFNTRLKEMGETWTYPYPRVGWWDDGKVAWSIFRKVASKMRTAAVAETGKKKAVVARDDKRCDRSTPSG